MIYSSSGFRSDGILHSLIPVTQTTLLWRSASSTTCIRWPGTNSPLRPWLSMTINRYRLYDVNCENVPYCRTNIVGPDQTPRIMRGVWPGPTIFAVQEDLKKTFLSFIKTLKMCEISWSRRTTNGLHSTFSGRHPTIFYHTLSLPTCHGDFWSPSDPNNVFL